ncbi:MAG: hypothetical protein D3923_13110 [Candidatus Electrothrix sp. AR3]|nr:hypothetical protein [Candidatus Electrothrix sp. AR3]
MPSVQALLTDGIILLMRNFSKNKLPVFDTCCRGRSLCLPGMQGLTQGFAFTVPGITGKIFLIKLLIMIGGMGSIIIA